MKFLNTSEVISQKLREEIVAFEIFIDGDVLIPYNNKVTLRNMSIYSGSNLI